MILNPTLEPLTLARNSSNFHLFSNPRGKNTSCHLQHGVVMVVQVKDVSPPLPQVPLPAKVFKQILSRCTTVLCRTAFLIATSSSIT